MTDRPLLPDDLLVDAIEATSGCTRETARHEAQAILDYLTAQGAHLVYDVTLPTSVPAGDPVTAASSIENLAERHWDVYETLVYYGPRTDEELVRLYDERGWQRTTPQSPSSIRSRRAELVRAGHVIDTGQRRPTSNGGTARVWQARESGDLSVAS